MGENTVNNFPTKVTTALKLANVQSICKTTLQKV